MKEPLRTGARCFLLLPSAILAGALTMPPAPAAAPRTHATDSVQIRVVKKKTVEVEVTSSTAFPVLNSVAVLTIGTQQSTLSRYPTGDLHTLIFQLTLEQLDRVRDGDRIHVDYDPGGPARWDLGKVDRSKIQR